MIWMTVYVLNCFVYVCLVFFGYATSFCFLWVCVCIYWRFCFELELAWVIVVVRLLFF